ncbi:uncharacterized protein LOC129250151 [Anastrepha obliqua]|uniref:uncharacterized protein LOC129250151 n=1 Tax=Anastrepha obliqua TaxID=95512 RepID=UPI00240A210B|nr:uncharacterized protein LOC129250151 [Anastrepha obliqua]
MLIESVTALTEKRVGSHAAIGTNAGRVGSLQRAKTEERRIIRQKKRETEIRECEELEMLANRNNARKFYQKVRRLTEGFKTGAFSYKNKDGDLVTDIQSSLKLWREHFSNFLKSDSCACHRECEDPDTPIDDDGIDVTLPDHDEMRIAITQLSNDKAAGADGLPSKLFKHGGEELATCMYKHLCKIWSDESMPTESNLSILCPIHKKGDPAIYANIKIHLDKSEFLKRETEFLGHIITPASVKKFPIPKSTKQIKELLGLTGFSTSKALTHLNITSS